MVGGVGGRTPLDIPPIPPLYSQRGVMPATRKVPLLPLVFRKLGNTECGDQQLQELGFTP
jgi:hypothetical protein